MRGEARSYWCCRKLSSEGHVKGQTGENRGSAEYCDIHTDKVLTK